MPKQPELGERRLPSNLLKLPKRLVCLDAFVISNAAEHERGYADELIGWLQEQEVGVLVHYLGLCEVFDTTDPASRGTREKLLLRMPQLILYQGDGISAMDTEIALWSVLQQAPEPEEVLLRRCVELKSTRERIVELRNIRCQAASVLAADREESHVKAFHRATILSEHRSPTKVTIRDLLASIDASASRDQIYERIASVDPRLGKGMPTSAFSDALIGFQHFLRVTSIEDAHAWVHSFVEVFHLQENWFLDLEWAEFVRYERLWKRMWHAYQLLGQDPVLSWGEFCRRLTGMDPAHFRSLDIFWRISDAYHTNERTKLKASSIRDFWHLSFSPHVPLLVADNEMASLHQQQKRHLSGPERVISGRVFRELVESSSPWPQA